METTSFEELCLSLSGGTSAELSALLPGDIRHEVGHFNVFNWKEIVQRERPTSPYPCRTFYKICFQTGRSVVEYPDQTIDIVKPTLLFSTPKYPYQWLPVGRQTGQFCVFTPDFLHPTKSGVIVDELPIFKSPEHPVYALTDAQAARVQTIFNEMEQEIASNYAYKYDLLRTYTLELIHLGQKLQSTTLLHPNHSAFARTTSLFVELLERQFPLENPQQKITLRTAKQFADHLAVHVNHLNKVLKETTGLTTTELIAGRIAQEAKILLRQTDWTIAEIADGLGFSDFAHFAKFFKTETSFAPGAFRRQAESSNYT